MVWCYLWMGGAEESEGQAGGRKRDANVWATGGGGGWGGELYRNAPAPAIFRI